MSTADKLSYLNGTKSAIKQAIIDKGVAVADDTTFREYADKISEISSTTPTPTPTTPTYTGHVDSEGLTAIGWTADDIAYYQANVTWNEEYDNYHLVSDYDKQIWQDYQDGTFVLPTVFSNNNKIYTYYPYIEHCPKFDTSNVTSASYMFNGCYNLVAVPVIDVSSVASLSYAFKDCYSLTVLDVSNWDTSSVTDLSYVFYHCYSLTNIIGTLNLISITSAQSIPFIGMYSLKEINVQNLGRSVSFTNSSKLSYTSIMYMINNAKTVTNQTLALGSVNLAKLTDEEIAIATNKGWTLV